MHTSRGKNEHLVLGALFKKIAPRIGATVLLEPEWNIAGQIIFKNGKKSYFRYNTIDLNPVGSADIAKDKDYSNFFMKSMGYPIVPGSKTFFSNQWADAIGSPERKIDAAYLHAQNIGLPVVVKPNSGSQGTGVAFVHTKKDFYRALRFIFKKDRVAIIQKPVVGNDYRLVVLDDKLISAYQRIPLNVIGDGRSSIGVLLEDKRAQFLSEGRDFSVHAHDSRILTKLKRKKLTLDSVIPAGEKIFLLDNANLSTGGESVDVTTVVHPDFTKIAIKLTKDMGLRFCGVDIMVDGTIANAPQDGMWFILEINAAPGLDHYIKTGKAQEKIVEDLYTKVLLQIES